MSNHKTSDQLFDYIECAEKGQSYSKPLNSEAKHLIEVFGSNLSGLKKQAEALHFMDNTFMG